ncbi:hypothetical protein B0O80DRAFT_421434 [Mortierella sp. GBAus27b]|nr:hypothetical protein B0O80DRAFT_421434 [Mortierella sp. GBAus27b]
MITDVWQAFFDLNHEYSHFSCTGDLKIGTLDSAETLRSKNTNGLDRTNIPSPSTKCCHSLRLFTFICRRLRADMVFHSATLSSRTTLSLQQSLELANLYLGNAQKTKDPEVVLELCNVTESVLSRTKRATKKPLSPNMQDEDRALGDEIAVAFSNLAKLQESLGQSEKAQASYKKAAQRGISVTQGYQSHL